MPNNKKSLEDYVYFKTENGTLYNGSCLDILPLLDNNSFQCVFTSPPYNCNVEYDIYKDNLPLKEYLEFLNKTFNLCVEKLSDGGHLGIQIANTGRQPYTPLTDFISTYLFNKIQMRGEIIWDKQNMTSATAWGSWLSSNCPSLRDSHEYIEVFRKEGNRKGESDITKEEFMLYTKAIWNVTPETQLREHPAPFPEKLAERFIKLYAFLNETVLDPFSGAGTVGLVCEKINRKYILIELSEKYCELSKKRILNYTNQLRMF